jgi:hypothetical protein
VGERSDQSHDPFRFVLQTATSHGALQVAYLKPSSQNCELGQQQLLLSQAQHSTTSSVDATDCNQNLLDVLLKIMLLDIYSSSFYRRLFKKLLHL